MPPPRPLARSVWEGAAGPVDLQVLDTGFFLIGQATLRGRTILDIRVAKSDAPERAALPAGLRGDDLDAAAGLIAALRHVLDGR